MIGKTINKELLVPGEPLITGAIGAALKATD
jgi:activator of 2-hydroxyglutaryl-CoA dehydratase